MRKVKWVELRTVFINEWKWEKIVVRDDVEYEWDGMITMVSRSIKKENGTKKKNDTYKCGSVVMMENMEVVYERKIQKRIFDEPLNREPRPSDSRIYRSNKSGFLELFAL